MQIRTKKTKEFFTEARHQGIQLLNLTTNVKMFHPKLEKLDKGYILTWGTTMHAHAFMMRSWISPNTDGSISMELFFMNNRSIYSGFTARTITKYIIKTTNEGLWKLTWIFWNFGRATIRPCTVPGPNFFEIHRYFSKIGGNSADIAVILLRTADAQLL